MNPELIDIVHLPANDRDYALTVAIVAFPKRGWHRFYNYGIIAKEKGVEGLRKGYPTMTVKEGVL